jgi:hypothetical protein
MTTGPWRVEVFRGGLVRVTCDTDAAVRLPTGADLRQARSATFGTVTPPNDQPLNFPDDWLLVRRNGAGLAVLPHANATLHATRQTVKLTGTTRAFWLAPAASAAQAWTARFATHPSVVLHGQGASWSGRVTLADRVAAVRVIDRDRNRRPDMTGDAWLFDAGADGKAELLATFLPTQRRRLHIFELNGRTLDEVRLQEAPAADGEVATSAYASLGMETPGRSPETTPPTTLLPTLVAEDFDGDGTFWRGSLTAGGFVAADRVNARHGEWSVAWDFGGDRLPDVWQYSKIHYLLNYFGEMTGVFGVDLDVTVGRAALRRTKGYDIQKAGSMFSKQCLAGRFYKGAAQAFEEHFFLDIKPDRFPRELPNGATLFYYTIRGDVNRMTMGRLGGSKDLRAWNIELDPTTNPAEVDWQLRQWSTPGGETLKLNTFSGPTEWSGRPMDLRDALAGWYAMAEGRYKTLATRATFAPPGQPSGSSEGMYGGALSTAERIEMDTDGGTYTLYFSPLMGDLHLKGAEFGSYAVPAGTEDFWLDINRYHHREAHVGSRMHVGAEPTLRWTRREGKRLEGPVFLGYRDDDGDGYFDNYVYDRDNDGLYERRLCYAARRGVMTLAGSRYTAAWPANVAFEDVRYLPENYDAVARLHRRAFRQPPMVVRTQLASSGTPVETVVDPSFREKSPEFFLTFDDAWQCRVAVDTVHAPGDGWRDFSPTGLSRLGTMFVHNGLTQATLDAPFSAESLADVDVLIVAGLDRMPTPDELTALDAWLRAGGTAVLNCPTDAAQRIRLAALGEVFGYGLAEEPLNRRTPIYRHASMGPINDPKTRAAIHRKPGPWNQVSRFGDPQSLGLLDGLDSLSFVAYPLTGLDDDARPLLTCEKHILMAERPVGRGRLIVSGADWWTNRYIWHHEEFENTDNDRLLERVVAHLTRPLPRLDVRTIARDENTTRATFTGRGGTVRFSRRYQPHATDLARIGQDRTLPPPARLAGVRVNGKPAPLRTDGTLWAVDVPAGEVSLEIRYEPVTDQPTP